jgi:phosphoribosylcarboxyaminoimidazole (NCAIR) mutase
VACVAVNGARNAAILAARIIENSGPVPPRGRPTAEL